MRALALCLLCACGSEAPDFTTQFGFDVWAAEAGTTLPPAVIDRTLSTLWAAVHPYSDKTPVRPLKIYFVDDLVAVDGLHSGWYSAWGWLEVAADYDACATQDILRHEFGHYIAHVEYGWFDVDAEHQRPDIWLCVAELPCLEE